MDFTVSDSEEDDAQSTSDSEDLERTTLCSKMCREVNTDISCLHMVDKST